MNSIKGIQYNNVVHIKTVYVSIYVLEYIICTLLCFSVSAYAACEHVSVTQVCLVG